MTHERVIFSINWTMKQLDHIVKPVVRLLAHESTFTAKIQICSWLNKIGM
jgi:hypothetical protein